MSTVDISGTFQLTATLKGAVQALASSSLGTNVALLSGVQDVPEQQWTFESSGPDGELRMRTVAIGDDLSLEINNATFGVRFLANSDTVGQIWTFQPVSTNVFRIINTLDGVERPLTAHPFSAVAIEDSIDDTDDAQLWTFSQIATGASSASPSTSAAASSVSSSSVPSTTNAGSQASTSAQPIAISTLILTSLVSEKPVTGLTDTLPSVTPSVTGSPSTLATQISIASSSSPAAATASDAASSSASPKKIYPGTIAGVTVGALVILLVMWVVGYGLAVYLRRRRDGIRRLSPMYPFAYESGRTNEEKHTALSMANVTQYSKRLFGVRTTVSPANHHSPSGEESEEAEHSGRSSRARFWKVSSFFNPSAGESSRHGAKRFSERLPDGRDEIQRHEEARRSW